MLYLHAPETVDTVDLGFFFYVFYSAIKVDQRHKASDALYPHSGRRRSPLQAPTETGDVLCPPAGATRAISSFLLF